MNSINPYEIMVAEEQRITRETVEAVALTLPESKRAEYFSRVSREGLAFLEKNRVAIPMRKFCLRMASEVRKA